MAALVEHECPNCGAQVEVQDERVAFCTYCGTKLITKIPPNNQHIKNYIDKAIHDLKQGAYKKCSRTINVALSFEPKNSELNLLKAVLSKENRYLSNVDEADISFPVVNACINHLAMSQTNKDENRSFYFETASNDVVNEKTNDEILESLICSIQRHSKYNNKAHEKGTTYHPIKKSKNKAIVAIGLSLMLFCIICFIYGTKVSSIIGLLSFIIGFLVLLGGIVGGRG